MKNTSMVAVREKDWSISCARLIAMCFIIACHMMQRDDFASDIYGVHIKWAFWFNIGVQMFLFISGFLYGTKRIDTVIFYKKAFSKILVDYYVFIFAMLIVIGVSPLLDIGFEGTFRLLTFSGTVPGLGHLWFVPTILFCYLLTPILSELLNTLDKRSDIRFWAEAILLVIIIHINIFVLFKSFNAAWINCFVFGMFYSRINERNKINKKVFNWIIVALCLLILPVQFRIDYWPHRDLPKLMATLYGQFTDYGHVFLGIAVVILIRFVFKILEKQIKTDNHPFLNWTDRYSYDVYLVHHVFVQSAFACVEFFSNRLVALPLAIMLTIIFSVILNYTSNYLRKSLSVMYQRLPE